jgi:hypothetical protein
MTSNIKQPGQYLYINSAKIPANTAPDTTLTTPTCVEAAAPLAGVTEPAPVAAGVVGRAAVVEVPFVRVPLTLGTEERVGTMTGPAVGEAPGLRLYQAAMASTVKLIAALPYTCT